MPFTFFRLALLGCLLSLSLYGFSQNNPPHQGVDMGPDTLGHVLIPGTRLYMIPPADFVLTHSFPGLLKTDGKAVIQVYDMPDGDYYEQSNSFTKDIFEAKGAKVLFFKQLTVCGFPAKYCYMRGDSAKKIMALIFGDSTFSATLIGLYPDTSLHTGDEIRDAYASIAYVKGERFNPLASAPFRLDTTVSPFRYAFYNKPLFVYTLDGNEPKQGSPFLSVTPYPRKEGSSLQEISENLLVKELQSGLSDPLLSNISLDSINGYEAYEVEVRGSLGGQQGMIYQFIVSSAGRTIVIEGVANNDFEKNVAWFKALAHTIKIL
jgi:hypothetical protein